MKKAISLLLLIVLLTTTLAACSGDTDEDQTLFIAAAASLEQVLEREIIPLFITQHPNITVRGNYHSSGALQLQIEQGAEFDIFFSAAMTQMDNLLEQALIRQNSVVPLLENTLVLITHQDTNTTVTGFHDILNAQSIAIGDPQSVPVGRYAREVFEHYGIWDEISTRASLGTNVTEVLTWVAAASAEVGVVYKTDAALRENVIILATAPPESLRTPILYPAGILTAAPNPEAAQQFLTFLQTPEALAIFENHGFIAP